MKEHKEYHDNEQLRRHYWVNDNGGIEGEYKEWCNNGQIRRRCFFKNGKYNGEYKEWHDNGQLEIHYFFHNDEEIDITEYVADKNNITEQEYFLLQMTFGYFPIIKYSGKL